MLRIVNTMPKTKFTQRFDEPLRVTVTNAIHNGTSQKSSMNINIPGVSAIPSVSPVINSSIIPGSMKLIMLWTDMAIAIKTHRTAIRIFHLNTSIMYAPFCDLILSPENPTGHLNENFQYAPPPLQIKRHRYLLSVLQCRCPDFLLHPPSPADYSICSYLILHAHYDAIG